MSTTARAWLPPGAIDLVALEAALAAECESWSATWFGERRGFALLAPFSRATDGEPDCVIETLDREDLALRWTSRIQTRIAASMLGVALDDARLTRDDRALAEALAARPLAELRAFVARSFGFDDVHGGWRKRDDAPPVEATYSFAIGRRGEPPLVAVVVGEALLVAMRKRRIAKPASAPPVEPLGEALALTSIALGGELGCCRLTLAQLDALTPGDVLVLERPLDAPLPIVVDGKAGKAGAVSLSLDGAALRLELRHPLSA